MFEEASFAGLARFKGASFVGDAWFQGGAAARFVGASFAGDATFEGASFAGPATFDRESARHGDVVFMFPRIHEGGRLLLDDQSWPWVTRPGTDLHGGTSAG